MTIIAYDGKQLVGDRAYTSCGHQRAVTKIYKVPGGMVGFSGDPGHIFPLLEWMRRGRPRGEYPNPPPGTDTCNALFITVAGEIIHYDTHEFGMKIDRKFDAIGCGRDYALAAMYLGHDAIKAIQVTIELDSNCGQGYDVITLEELQREAGWRK